MSINVLSNQLAVEELKWKPKIDLHDGVKRMCKMWNKEKQVFEEER